MHFCVQRLIQVLIGRRTMSLQSTFTSKESRRWNTCGLNRGVVQDGA
jgi:hypothetical protein